MYKEINSILIISIVVLLTCLTGYTHGIKCYKCKGDDECDFKTRAIYVENCTWATKCWGARIGDHFIRGCADDRCDIQIGVGSYIESKCCYTELCNNESFFFPSSANLNSSKHSVLFTIINLLLVFIVKKTLQ